MNGRQLRAVMLCAMCSVLVFIYCGCTKQPQRNNGKQMDRYLNELFARPDDFMLVNQVFGRISESCDGSDAIQLRALPKEQKVVLDVWGSYGIIGNGGFQYLFEGDLADIP